MELPLQKRIIRERLYLDQPSPNSPVNLPGLKAGASSRFTLSGACYPVLKDGASRRRTGQLLRQGSNNLLPIIRSFPFQDVLMDASTHSPI